MRITMGHFLGGAAVGVGILYMTNASVYRTINILGAAFFGIGPEAKNCQRSDWWTLCLPSEEIEGKIQNFSKEGKTLTIRVAERKLSLFGVAVKNDLSGPAYEGFWNTLQNPANGGGYAHCVQNYNEFQCFLDSRTLREGYDISRIAIRGGIAEPSGTAPESYRKDFNWFKSDQPSFTPIPH